MYNLFAMLYSPTPADLSLFHHVDYPTLTYSVCVRGNSQDVLLRSVLMDGRVYRTIFHLR